MGVKENVERTGGGGGISEWMCLGNVHEEGESGCRTKKVIM